MLEVKSNEDVSAIILWVDGDDPIHRAKRNIHLNRSDCHAEGVRDTRFRSVGEIDYCILSILKFAPFISKIFVVTDSQMPPLFKKIDSLPSHLSNKLQLVDHKEIFGGHEHVLPTFNSLSIATVLHRIAGLSEKFILFNDDVFLIKPIDKEHFFRDEKPVFRGRWIPQPHFIESKRVLKARLLNMLGKQFSLTPTYQRSQIKAAKLAGFFMRYFRLDHTPKALLKSNIEMIFENHPGWLAKNIAHRSRDISQFHTPSLACHSLLLTKQASIEEELGLLYLEPQKLDIEQLKKHLMEAELNDSMIFACIQSLDEAGEDRIMEIKQWLTKITDAEKFMHA